MNKEIEEMAKIANCTACDYKQGTVKSKTIYMAIAEAIYKYLTEDSVVLTREEFEKIYNQARNEMACAIVRAVFDEIDWSKDTKTFETYILNLANEYSMLETIEEEIRKETVEKIWERANHDFIGLDEISLKVLKSIIKHDIGVEIKE